jgi:hypothetical protein
MSSIEGMRSEGSESELSDILNTTAFGTVTYVTTGDLPDLGVVADLPQNVRVFSCIKEDLMEALECLKAWWDSEIIMQS